MLEGCGGGGGGHGKAGPAPEQDKDKMEDGCDQAVSGCCITKANGGCPGMRCEGINGGENRFYACADDMDDKDKCTVDGCEEKCKENKHMPTEDGGSTCINYAFSADGRHPNSCMLHAPRLRVVDRTPHVNTPFGNYMYQLPKAQISDGSLSSVSTPIFATKYSFCSVFRDLKD